MNSVSIQQLLRRRTAETLTQLSQTRRRENQRRDVAPRPGDLFVFPATADFEVQWAVLDWHPHQAEVLLVVPADLNPQVGSSDVAVPAVSAAGVVASSGALTLRCRYGVWLPMQVFDLDKRTGCLAPEPLELARRKWLEIDRGVAGSSAVLGKAVLGKPVRGSALQRETDTEPEYQDWTREVLSGAHAALAGLGEVAWEESRGPVYAKTDRAKTDRAKTG